MKKLFLIFFIILIIFPQAIFSNKKDKDRHHDKDEKLKRWEKHIENQMKWIDEQINNEDFSEEERDIYREMKEKFVKIVENLKQIQQLYDDNKHNKARELEQENRELEFEIDLLRTEKEKLHIINKLLEETGELDNKGINNSIKKIEKHFDKMMDNERKINDLRMRNMEIRKEIEILEKKIEIEILESEIGD